MDEIAHGYDAIVFDFDGVIVNSEAYKIETFKSLFTAYPNKIDEIDEYNRRERGVNRHIKFEYIYKNILELPYDNTVIEKLADEYGDRLGKDIGALPLMRGVKEFLAGTTQPKFIASSSEQSEIKKAVLSYEIDDYFQTIYSYPLSKKDSINSILDNLKILPNQLLFIGDARADYETAVATKVGFVARSDNADLFPKNVRRINDFHSSD